MCFKVLASYHRPVPHQTLCIVCLGLSCLAPTCFAEGTVRDGLLDFVHVPGFSANAGGDSSFSSCGVQDLDAANLLIRANTLDLRRNQMTSLSLWFHPQLLLPEMFNVSMNSWVNWRAPNCSRSTGSWVKR